MPPLLKRVADSSRSFAAELRLIALPDFPQVAAGDDLAALTTEALARAGLVLRTDDVLVFAQKVISKAEGRRIDLADVVPSTTALELARTVQKDPRLVELVLRESQRVVRSAKDVLIVEHRLGLIMANAGIDQSNVADPSGGEFALLLPEDPDASAALTARGQFLHLAIVERSRGGLPVFGEHLGHLAASGQRGREDAFEHRGFDEGSEGHDDRHRTNPPVGANRRRRPGPEARRPRSATPLGTPG